MEVSLDADGVASYVIHEDAAWDHIPASDLAFEVAEKARAMNFGSLAQRGAVSRWTIQALLDRASADYLKIFDINLRPGFVRRDILEAGFAWATLVKTNVDELAILGDIFSWTSRPEAILDNLLAAYPESLTSSSPAAATGRSG